MLKAEVEAKYAWSPFNPPVVFNVIVISAACAGSANARPHARALADRLKDDFTELDCVKCGTFA